MGRRLWPIRVFYDGGCGLCRRQAQSWRREDRSGRLELVDISARGFRAEEHGLDPERVRQSMHVKTADGRLFEGLDAVRMVWTVFPRMWAAAVLAGLPGVHGVLRAGYRSVARNRHRLSDSCADGSCSRGSDGGR